MLHSAHNGLLIAPTARLSKDAVKRRVICARRLVLKSRNWNRTPSVSNEINQYLNRHFIEKTNHFSISTVQIIFRLTVSFQLYFGSSSMFIIYKITEINSIRFWISIAYNHGYRRIVVYHSIIKFILDYLIKSVCSKGMSVNITTQSNKCFFKCYLLAVKFISFQE